jgi:hypothetical protein
MSTLKNFLHTGELDGICMGMAREAAEAVLGEPSAVSVGNKPRILKYGNVELGFYWQAETRTSGLAHVSVYFRVPSENYHTVTRFADWTVSQRTKSDEFEQFIKNAGMVPRQFPNEQSLDFRFDSGASATFDQGFLHSLHFTQPDRNVKKQLSLPLNCRTVEKIQKQARSMNRSAAELCAAWIEEKVAAEVK